MKRWLQLIALLVAAAVMSPAFCQDAPSAPQQGVPAGQKLAPIVNFGFVGGMLVVPFKFHPSDHSLTGGGTAAGYVGWRSSWMGLTVTPIVSAGLSLSDARYGTGFSVASGLIGSVANSPIHFGLVAGTDWYAKSLQYPYDGKLWLAVEVGYNFSQ